MTMSHSQQVALALLPKFTGSISIFFSSLVVYSIFRQKKRHVYDRLIFGISSADILGSFAMALSTWPIPKSYGTLWASGNQATCDAQGVFTQGATVASALYMGSLTTYFLLVVNFRWKEAKLKQYEWAFHLVPVVWGLGTGIATVPMKLTNNANLWCFIAENNNDPSRGKDADFYRMLFFYGPLYLTFVVVTVNVIVVVSFVRRLTTKALNASIRIEDRSRELEDEALDEDDAEHVASAQGGLNDADDADVESTSERTATDQPIPFQASAVRASLTSTDCSNSSHRANMKNNRYAIWRRRVSRQNLRFAIAFYYTWFPISCVRMLQMSNRSVPFWLLVVATITTPCQGFCTLLVYFYPKYKSYRKQAKTRQTFCLVRWIQAGMTTSDVGMYRARDRNEDPPTGGVVAGNSACVSPRSGENIVLEEKQRRPNAETDENSRPSALFKRKVVPAVSSMTVSGLEPIQETESMYKEKWVDTARPIEAPLKKPNRVVSEASCMSRKVSFKEEDDDIPPHSGMQSSASTSSLGSSQTIPSSILKHSNHDSVPIVSDLISSYAEDICDEDSDELTPERGDTSRWQALSTPKSDHSPGVPRRVNSGDSEEFAIPPVVDRPPGMPRRLISECIE